MLVWNWSDKIYSSKSSGTGQEETNKQVAANNSIVCNKQEKYKDIQKKLLLTQP